MDKIIRIALESKGFAQAQVNNVLAVCKATNNTEIALEMLLGIYIEPEIPKTKVLEDDRVFHVIEFDPFRNRVSVQSELGMKYKFFNAEKSDYSWHKTDRCPVREEYKIMVDTDYYTLSEWKALPDPIPVYYKEEIE